MKNFLKLLFVPLAFVASAAQADIYLGGGVYGTSLDADGFDGDVAPAVFLGWRPIELAGVEVGYYDFGEFEQSGGGSVDASAVTLAGLLSMELGPVGLYAKGGIAGTTFKAVGAKDDSTDPFAGVGLTVDLMDKLYVYGEVLRFATDDAVDVYGVGLRYSF
jgi:hypothetical protein